jgi:hypothetical protein
MVAGWKEDRLDPVAGRFKEVDTIDPTGAHAEFLVASAVDPDWSPDGSQLVFAAAAPLTGTLRSSTSEANRVRELTHDR